MVYLFIALGIAVLDQLSKLLVRTLLVPGGIVRLFDSDLVWLVYVLNPGLAFGIRLLPPIVLTLVALVASMGLGIYLYSRPFIPVRLGLPLALIMGGAVGNMIDRLFIGQVVDFLSVDMPDFIMLRWPAFNVADSAVSVGVVSLVVFSIFSRQRAEDQGRGVADFADE